MDSTTDSSRAYEPPADPQKVSSAADARVTVKSGPFFDGAGYASVPTG